MKELTLEEVRGIAGGVPAKSALDDLSYATPEARTDPIDHARLLETEARTQAPG